MLSFPARRYPGTLTTPSCAQSVTFYVLQNPLPVSYRQVVQFTNLLAAAQGGISRGADNRPPNPILAGTVVRAPSLGVIKGATGSTVSPVNLS